MVSGSRSGRTPPSRGRRSTRRWKHAAWPTPSAFRRTKVLELAIEGVLFRSPGRPRRKPLVCYKSFHYQADSWTTARRVVAKVEHHAGELSPRVGFIVTNLQIPNRAI